MSKSIVSDQRKFSLSVAQQLRRIASSLRDAKNSLEQMELLNEKISGDFYSILDYCTELEFEMRQLVRKQMEGEK